MRVCVIDTETTGLDPKVHSIIEIAAYNFDLDDPNQPHHIFHRYAYPEGMVWSAYCLKLHKAMIEMLIEGRISYDKKCEIFTDFETPKAVDTKNLFRELEQWHMHIAEVDQATGKKVSFIGAGKNFGTFDWPFIQNLPGYRNIFKHRVMDPTAAYRLRTDKVPPELAECKKRAAAMGANFNRLEVTHTALDDCMDVVELLRFAEDNRTWKHRL